MFKQIRNWAFISCLLMTVSILALWVTSCISPASFRVVREPVSPAVEFQDNSFIGVALKPGYVDIEYIGQPLDSAPLGSEVMLSAHGSEEQYALLVSPGLPAGDLIPTGVRANYAGAGVYEVLAGAQNKNWHHSITSPIAFTSARWSQCCWYRGSFVFMEIPFYLLAFGFGYWPAFRLFRWICRRPADPIVSSNAA